MSGFYARQNRAIAIMLVVAAVLAATFLAVFVAHAHTQRDNKDRIGKALGNFITNNFLTAAVMNERLARIDMVGALARWLSSRPMPSGWATM